MLNRIRASAEQRDARRRRRGPCRGRRRWAAWARAAGGSSGWRSRAGRGARLVVLVVGPGLAEALLGLVLEHRARRRGAAGLVEVGEGEVVVVGGALAAVEGTEGASSSLAPRLHVVEALVVVARRALVAPARRGRGEARPVVEVVVAVVGRRPSGRICGTWPVGGSVQCGRSTGSEIGSAGATGDRSMSRGSDDEPSGNRSTGRGPSGAGEVGRSP